MTNADANGTPSDGFFHLLHRRFTVFLKQRGPAPRRVVQYVWATMSA